MVRRTRSKSEFGAVAIVSTLLAMAMALCLFIVVSLASTVSGTAALPNGLTAKINGPFTCSENTSQTEIEAGGHTFVFSPTEISIDGVPVGPLDARVTAVQIDASFWSASLRINGNKVSKIK